MNIFSKFYIQQLIMPSEHNYGKKKRDWYKHTAHAFTHTIDLDYFTLEIKSIFVQ
jgi:hypothetical protein